MYSKLLLFPCCTVNKYVFFTLFIMLEPPSKPGPECDCVGGGGLQRLTWGEKNSQKIIYENWHNLDFD